MSKNQAELFFDEVVKNKELQDKVETIVSGNFTQEQKADLLGELVLKNNFKFTKNEILEEKRELEKNLTLKDLEDVSGGFLKKPTVLTIAALSSLSLMGSSGSFIASASGKVPKSNVNNQSTSGNDFEREGDGSSFFLEDDYSADQYDGEGRKRTSYGNLSEESISQNESEAPSAKRQLMDEVVDRSVVFKSFESEEADRYDDEDGSYSEEKFLGGVRYTFSQRTGTLTIKNFSNGRTVLCSSDIIDIIREEEKSGAKEFRNRIKSVHIKNGIKKIGYRAFEGFKNLQEVEFPKTLKTIGIEAFFNCGNLKKINFPESLEKIDSGAFMDCISLEVIFIPSNVKHIGEYSFAACNGLKDIFIPSGDDLKIASEAFSRCNNLTNLYLPERVKSLGFNAFYNCANLSRVSFGGKVKLEDGVFESCSNLAEVYFEGIDEIPYYLFYECKNLKQVRMPTDFNKIGEDAFYGCENLKQIVWKNNFYGDLNKFLEAFYREHPIDSSENFSADND